MLAAPLQQRSQDRTERAALRRQQVFGARRMLLVEAALDHAGLLEPLQPGRERVGADPVERALEILETSRPLEEEVPDFWGDLGAS